MKKFFIGYGIIGILIISILIYFQTKGLSDKTIKLYQQGIELSEEVERNIWKDFNLEDYPVAIRQRDIEYVFDKNSKTKRKPALPIVACTAFPVEGEVNVFMLSKEELDTLGEFAEGIGDGEKYIINQIGINKDKMMDEQYLAILYHEGLHAYQLTYYEDKLMSIFNEQYREIDEKEILNRIDKEPILSYYQKEVELLYEAVTTESNDEAIFLGKEYINRRQDRIEYLEKEWSAEEVEVLKEQEHFYELTEGTAKYMEEQILVKLEKEDLVQKYLESIKGLPKQKQKYYNSGMGICLLLDRLNITWKEDVFKNPIPLDQRLEKGLEGLK